MVGLALPFVTLVQFLCGALRGLVEVALLVRVDVRSIDRRQLLGPARHRRGLAVRIGLALFARALDRDLGEDDLDAPSLLVRHDGLPSNRRASTGASADRTPQPGRRPTLASSA